MLLVLFFNLDARKGFVYLRYVGLSSCVLSIFFDLSSQYKLTKCFISAESVTNRNATKTVLLELVGTFLLLTEIFHAIQKTNIEPTFKRNVIEFFAGKYLSASLILSDTDDDSDDESTVFEAKKRSMNGSVNGYIRKDT